MSVNKPAVMPSGDERAGKVEVFNSLMQQLADPEQVIENWLTEGDGVKDELFMSIYHKLSGLTQKERDDVEMRLIAESSVLIINDRRLWAEVQSDGTIYYRDCVRVPIASTSTQVDLNELADLRGIDPALIDFQLARHQTDLTGEEKREIQMRGLTSLAKASQTTLITYYYHNYDTIHDPIDSRHVGYHVFRPDGSVWEIVEGGADKLELKNVTESQ